MKNKIIIHAAGGCGINIGKKLIKEGIVTTDDLEIAINFLDASISNNKDIPSGYDFFHIKTNKLANSDICGSGGERLINVDDKVFAAKEYLDARGETVNIVNEFHVVLFSGSGGSGSVLGPMIIKELLNKDMVVVAIDVSDTKDVLTTISSVKTLKTLRSIAQMTNTSLSVLHCLNDEKGRDRETKVDNRITDFVNTLRTFLSNTVSDIDTQDMRNFFNQHLYKTIDIPVGLYSIEFDNEECDFSSQDGAVTTARILTDLKNNYVSLPDNVLHTKYGKMGTKYHGDKNTVCMVSINGIMNKYINDFGTMLEQKEENSKNLTTDSFEDGASETGLVL